MKARKILAASFAAVLLATQTMTISANDTVITLDESAEGFVQIESDLDFQEMLPGEERTAVIVLTNSTTDNMDFYLSGELIRNIADATDSDKNAIYELELQKDSEDTPFFQGMVGSKDNSHLTSDNLGLSYLKEDTLIATLKQGETARVSVRVTLDGDSVDDTYRNQTGLIRLTISTSQSVRSSVVTSIQDILEIQTGDTMRWYLYFGAAIIAFVIVFAVTFGMKRKNKKRDHEMEADKNE